MQCTQVMQNPIFYSSSQVYNYFCGWTIIMGIIAGKPKIIVKPDLFNSTPRCWPNISTFWYILILYVRIQTVLTTKIIKCLANAAVRCCYGLARTKPFLFIAP